MAKALREDTHPAESEAPPLMESLRYSCLRETG
jgi:hypothetical protein